jgi:hypothetical protein
MMLRYERDRGILHWGDQVLVCPCDVRSIANGRRRRLEKVVYSELADGKPGVPYDPKPFPKGAWIVTGIYPKTEPYEAPFFIATTATQKVEEWTEEAGHYGQPTGRQVDDYGYGIHCSTSPTTLGCGRLSERPAAALFFEAIQAALKERIKIKIDVV